MCHCGDAWCDLSREDAAEAEKRTQVLMKDPEWVRKYPDICDRDYAVMNYVRRQMNLGAFYHPMYDK